MAVKLINYNIKTNDTFLFKKGNYLSFNSANPFKYNPYAYKLKEYIRLERGIVEEVKDSKVIISYCDRKYNLKVHFKRRVDQAKLISKTRLYLRYAEEHRVPWYGSEGCSSGYILQFDSKGRPARYIKPKVTPIIKSKILQYQQVVQHKLIPTIDNPPSSPTKN